MNTNDSLISHKPSPGEPWDVVIIGSGPSGLTACIYTTRGAASTLLFAGDSWGGQLMLTTTVDNFPGMKGIDGPDLMTKMREHAGSFGAEIVDENVERVTKSGDLFEVASRTKKVKTRSVIIATGADTKWLQVKGEEEFRGRGVSSCAPCDAAFFKNKRVVVVGGGDSAMEEALVLSKFASHVSIVHRRDKLRASQAMQKRVVDANIPVLWSSGIQEILGKDVVTSVVVKTNKNSEHFTGVREIIKERGGELSDDAKEHAIWNLPIDGVFVAIGHTPSTEVFKGLVELDNKGYVVKKTVNGFKHSTSEKGIFVAGDVHDHHYRQAITAAGFGCMAAMDCLNYLELQVPTY